MDIDYNYILSDINGISSDSREIKPGFIFVAIRGNRYDGHNYVKEALSSGAKYIIYQHGNLKSKNCLKVSDTRYVLSMLLSKFYGKQPKNIVAVTGTNGKSSVVSFYMQLINLLGQKAASIGTIGLDGLNCDSCDSVLTTPPPEKLYKILATVCAKDYQYLAIEASSHGLVQKRLDGISLRAAAFTNLSQDHLDYHQTMDSYFAAKMYLFRSLLPKNCMAVINSDSSYFNKIKQICREKNLNIFDYGKSAKVLNLEKIILEQNKVHITLRWQKHQYKTSLTLIGEFQIYNLMAAIGLVMASGFAFVDIFALLPKIVSVTGRMQMIPNKHNYTIVVDYAHTPDALVCTLKALRPFAKAKLIILFGCGGDRDKDKRKLMGDVVAKLADYVIITDDNPRNEDPASIREEIIAEHNFINIGNRAIAIAHAIDYMGKDDVLLIAGKGHENYQILGDQKYKFSDVETVRHLVN